MSPHLPWAVHLILGVVLTLAALGLLAMFVSPMLHSEEAGVNLHSTNEPTMPEDDGPIAGTSDGHTGAMRAVLRSLFERYRRIAQDPSVPANPGAAPGTELDQVVDLCDTALNHLDDQPLDTLNRWLGFVQGVLAVNGLIDVAAERAVVHPAFHQLA